MMQARRAVALFAVILSVLFFACSDPKEEMRVSGRVMSNEDGDPVAGAHVSLRAIGGEMTYSAHTVGSASTTSGSSGSFDVTVEVDSDKRHDWAEVTITADGYQTHETGMPFGDRLNWTVLLEPSP